jgi:hypothetical protein
VDRTASNAHTVGKQDGRREVIILTEQFFQATTRQQFRESARAGNGTKADRRRIRPRSGPLQHPAVKESENVCALTIELIGLDDVGDVRCMAHTDTARGKATRDSTASAAVQTMSMASCSSVSFGLVIESTMVNESPHG